VEINSRVKDIIRRIINGHLTTRDEIIYLLKINHSDQGDIFKDIEETGLKCFSRI